MSDTLYIQTDENMEVHHPHVYLQDIVKLSCSNSKILNRLRVLPVASLDPKRPGRYVLSAMDLIREIQKKEPDHSHWRTFFYHYLPNEAQHLYCMVLV